ncbi:MAG: hypothetical protein IJ745_04025 [Bacteroidales bacterium]|nr:hypothetical protein [Bacteroidales bacterium]
MKRLLTLTLAVLATVATTAQQRDRRVDLNIPCGYHIDMSATGRLWIGDRCGDIYTADSIGTSWRTAVTDNDPIVHSAAIERIAAFGDNVAVAAGFMYDEGHVLRTTNGGALWDTVAVDSSLVWVHGLCFHADGHLWMAASSGRDYKCMVYSTDSGRTYTLLHPDISDTGNFVDGIYELYMATAYSGFAGTFGGNIYSTADNWRTAQSLATPIDQGVMEANDDNTWVTRIRPWRQWLIATLHDMTYATPTDGDSLHWQPMPWITYEVDTSSGNLWAVSNSGQLIYLTDMERQRVVGNGLSFPLDIVGVRDGNVYLNTSVGVVRVRPDGHADTCGFFSEQTSLEEALPTGDDIYSSEWVPTLSHGGRLWTHDNKSIYLHDVLGWYRIAKVPDIRRMFPDPDRSDRVVILCYDNRNYSVDTVGRVESYVYHQQLASFLSSGLKKVEIATYNSGCFHYDRNTITYTRKGDLLREKKRNFGRRPKTKRSIPASAVEEALRRMDEAYSLFPVPTDFGMQEGEVDLQKVFKRPEWCTTSSGYEIVFVNQAGDTLTAYGNSDVDCGEYFPWLLPMHFASEDFEFVSYQPMLWQALRPMLPEDMMLQDKLNNNAFFDLRPGDLLFYRDEGGMNDAISASTGQYTHVALVESVGDTVWIIDATQRYGVSRRPMLRTRSGAKPYPDVYRVTGCRIIDSVLARARSFIGQPYDNAFLPGNGALYCSELIYECFLDDCSDEPRHIFEAKPMNWRDSDGNLPEYWKTHFGQLGTTVPEGVLGTNPTDMSRSHRLKAVGLSR